MTTTPAVLTDPVTKKPIFRTMLMWTVSFLGIPIAGYLGTAIVGRVDNLGSALAGGAVAGLLIGFVQALVSQKRLPLVRWTVASTAGAGIGVALGTLAVDYETSLGALAIAATITGAIVGIAQTFALPTTVRLRWVWVPVTAVLWPLAWTVTTLAGIKVEQQFIIFGASGAFVYTVLAGLVLLVLLPRPAAPATARDASTRR